ncbi:NADH-quinone oxidoreductase subunit L [Chitinophaga sp. XS-30]|uniref:NADH-quinone oxidoreductase subunit L n=1 Tax=Chitinophaga sp. XS-30 TaxID=2604421 RepID=UPI0011DCE219|nr:NADH-quinone oxidoreductase subunit L [Chitinophaga sp. XS-30]QEH42814.1 NADH-quinone oxidoreductase subunit L [Chitinophaga sp. XS-30]
MQWIYLIPALPFLGALILILFSRRIGKAGVSVIGCGSVGIAALITVIAGFQLMGQESFTLPLWTWLSVGELNIGITLHLDALSLAFTFVITFVGFLIHVYSTGYMSGDPDFARFFACMNLFVGAMLMLVLADNLLLLYFGWEGVGICSYLLIGFWYKDPANGAAARKAFIVTRVGDTAMAIALFLLVQHTQTLQLSAILERAPALWSTGDATVVTIAFLLIGGAVGKSAQLPLQTWLPDAMAGPTPVSALIHAATMVTAGVYLIARTNVLFTLSPAAQATVAVIGAVTLLMAGCSALVQTDIKRVLAYSTISQIGYMFLALGVGAWSAAIFHFITHAFFKALLFMGAGAIIVALHHEQDMFKMGGLRKALPGVFVVFLIGAASLAAIPFVTAGFYSKDQIVWLAWTSPLGGTWYWIAAITGAFITAMYTFRMVFLVFYGAEKTHVHHHPGNNMMVPLYMLAILSTVAGFIELPHTLGHVTLLSDFLSPVLPAVESGGSVAMEWASQGVAAALSFLGIFLVWRFLHVPFADGLKQFWKDGWGFDVAYDRMFVRPFVLLSRINKKDIVDRLYTGIASVTKSLHRMMSATQNGMLRWYVMGIVMGAVVILSVIIWREFV